MTLKPIRYLVVALTYVFLFAPVLVVVASSFDAASVYSAQFPPRSFGLRWYREIPPRFWESLLVSVSASSIAAVVAACIGVIAAMGLVRGRPPGGQLLRTYFRIPLNIPFVVTGVAFLQFYYSFGGWTGVDLVASLPGLVLAYVFVSTPYTIASVSTVLERLGERREEASAACGANQTQTFFHVTRPMITPALITGTLYAFIFTFGDVPLSIFLSSPSFTTLPVEIFQTLQFDFSPTVLCISSINVLISIGIVVIIQFFSARQ